MRIVFRDSRWGMGWILFTAMLVAHGGGIDAADAGEARDVSLPESRLTRTALAAEALEFDEIIFVKRKPYSSDHYYTDINNGTSGDRFLEKNGIYIFNVRTRSERPVVTAAELPGGRGLHRQDQLVV